MRPRLVLCYPAEAHHLDQIARTAPGYDIIDAGQARIAQELFQADIYFGHAKVPVDWRGVVHQGRLKWIQSSAAGIDHCLTPEVIASCIPVTSCAGLFANQVAEQTMAILLALLRNLPAFHRAQLAHRFERLPTDDLRGKTVGIIGFGGNGQQIGLTLTPFKPRVVAVDLRAEMIEKPAWLEALYPVSVLDRVLPQLDIQIVCVPLTQHTRGMFDLTRFRRFKPRSIFINVARGEVVDESALITAIREGIVAKAGLDVTETEPLPGNSPLWDMENVLITPHVGAQGFDRLDRTTDFFCENFRRFAADRPLLNLVDKNRGF